MLISDRGARLAARAARDGWSQVWDPRGQVRARFAQSDGEPHRNRNRLRLRWGSTERRDLYPSRESTVKTFLWRCIVWRPQTGKTRPLVVSGSPFPAGMPEVRL
jgi:hypothetical protein